MQKDVMQFFKILQMINIDFLDLILIKVDQKILLLKYFLFHLLQLDHQLKQII